MKHALLIVAGMLALGTGTAHGHGNAADANETDLGHPGDPAKVSRTVDVTMTDAMRFAPAVLKVKKDETVRFVVHNDGKVAHEMVLGTSNALLEHAELMRRFPEMEHDDPNMVRVGPGGRAEMVWTFDKAGRFAFACLVPGHFEAGMKGEVEVR